MSNTSTKVDTIPVQIGGMYALNEYEIAIDTLATDLVIQVPESTNRIWLVGLSIAETNALNLTFKSVNPNTLAVSKSRTMELAPNQGTPGYIDNGFYFVTNQGEQLSIQSSMPIGSTVGKNLVLLVGEAPNFRRI